MNKHYYVNKNAQPNGDHEVHTENCDFLPDVLNRVYLGYFDSCEKAVTEAVKIFPQSNGCYFCARECHTS